MRGLSRLNKFGVSIMVGYVVLIALTIGLSIGVFVYLKLYLPSEEPRCPDDVSISVDEVTCTVTEIDINISNRGLFNIDSVFIKVGDVDRVFKDQINSVDNRWNLGSTKCDIGNYLKPGQKFCGHYTLDNDLTGLKEISIEPLIYVGDKPVICTDAVIKKSVNCA